jgi:hypothetical protein
MNNINKSEIFSKVTINVLFITLFITIFFFTYGSYIEKKVVQNQMDILSKDIIDFLNLFGQDFNKIISDQLNNVTLPDLSEEDKKIKNNNNKIIIKTMIYLLFFIVILSSIIYYNYIAFSDNSYKMSKIILENLLILLAICMTEFIFVSFFIYRYVSIDSNTVKLVILKLFKEKNLI